MSGRPVALVTGASRRIGIGAAIVSTPAADGWDVATTYRRACDAEVSPGGAGINGQVLGSDGGLSQHPRSEVAALIESAR